MAGMERERWVFAAAATGAAGLALLLFLKHRRNAAVRAAPPLPKLEGKLALVTGASSGLGRRLARELATAGASVVLAGRDRAALEDALAEIKAALTAAAVPTYSLSLALFDLRSLRSVQEFGRQFRSRYDKLDILVNNAGIMGAPYALTDDAIESHFQVNHLAHFLLTNELKEPLLKSSNGRVVIVSSGKYMDVKAADWSYLQSRPENYARLRPYSRSKLANCLHGLELAKRQPQLQVAVCSPGFVLGTQLGRHYSAVLRTLAWPLGWFFSRSLDQGIQTLLFAATAPLPLSGAYYANCQLQVVTRGERREECVEWAGALEEYTAAVTEAAAADLWALSDRLVAEALAGRRFKTVEGDIVLKKE